MIILLSRWSSEAIHDNSVLQLVHTTTTTTTAAADCKDHGGDIDSVIVKSSSSSSFISSTSSKPVPSVTTTARLTQFKSDKLVLFDYEEISKCMSDHGSFTVCTKMATITKEANN